MSPNLSGQVVDHRYRLVRAIGAGGSATIYEAIDTNLDKRVAVKILSPQHWDDPIQVARFQREARSIARIRHEHLVDVTHHGMTDDGMPFLVMELLAGWDLQAELHRLGGAMPWPRAIGVAIQLLGALTAAHEAGVVHRDVKPGNCFLVRRRDGGDFIKLLDLGIAKVQDDTEGAPPLTRVSVGVPGTVHYMAPEQVRGLAVDARADVYSLGVMLYRMLAGALPFVVAGDSPYEVMRLHCEAPPPWLRDTAPAAGVPAELDAAIQRALAKDPDARWPSAEAFADALALIGSQATRAALPLLHTERAPIVPARSRRPLIALTLGVLALMILGVLALTSAPRRADATRDEASPSAASAIAASLDAAARAAAIARTQAPTAAPPQPLVERPRVDDHDHDHDHDHSAIAEPTPSPEPVHSTRSKPHRKRPPKRDLIDPIRLALSEELRFQRAAFARCRALAPAGAPPTIRFTMTLAPGSGDVLAVTPKRGDTSKATACVVDVLGTMHFHAGSTGGTFKNLELAL